MRAMSREPAIHYLGHSTLLIEIDGLRVLTDPAIRPIIGPLVRSGRAPDPARLHDLDVALISHLHRDHLDMPSLRLLPTRPLLVVPRGAAALLIKAGFHEFVEMAPGESVTVGGVTIKATFADHPGNRPPGGPTGPAMGFLVEGAWRRIYFAGDTDIFPAMADLGAPDIALLPVGGWGLTLGRGHMDPVRAAESLRLIRPRFAVPIHWGTFWPRGLGRVRVHRKSGGGALFERHAAQLAPEVRVLVTMPGERVRFPAPDEDR
jgi:L-ascorbate metabolism protein UlaG (beta-lactamase superfamily)